MKNIDNYLLIPACEAEIISIRGGASGYDAKLAEYIGMGVGYLAKKLWKGFLAYSNYIYELQKETMIIYK